MVSRITEPPNTGTQRDEAKAAISSTMKADPELNQALQEANVYSVRILEAKIAHRERMHDKSLGKIGAWCGDGKLIPVVTAFIGTLGGVLYAFVGEQPEIGFGFAGTSLGFIFGTAHSSNE